MGGHILERGHKLAPNKLLPEDAQAVVAFDSYLTFCVARFCLCWRISLCEVKQGPLTAKYTQDEARTRKTDEVKTTEADYEH